MDVTLRLHLMGRMQAWTARHGNLLPSGRRTRALLAAVALAGPKPALRLQLAALLWTDRPREQARSLLRREIARLRDALMPASTELLQITRDTVILRQESAWIDVKAYMMQAPDRLASMPPPEGDLLEDLDGLNPNFDAWLERERNNLRGRIRSSAEALLRQQNGPDEAIRLARHLLRIDPTNEYAWRALMSAHAERGERQLAIQAYDQCAVTLANLANCSPSLQTNALAGAIRESTPRPAPRCSSPADLSKQSATPNASTVLPHRLRVGVLPLVGPGRSASAAEFGVALGEDISVLLGRHTWITVLSPKNLAPIVGAADEADAARHAFGIDLLLRGTVHCHPNAVRATLWLIDLRMGPHVVWTGRFDRETNLPEMARRDIAAKASAQTEREMLTIEAARAAGLPEAELTPHTLTMRALPLTWQMSRESFIEAGKYLDRALALDTDFVPALMLRAFWYVHEAGQGWAENPTESITLGAWAAQRAVAFEPRAARPSAIAGHVQAFLQHDLDEAASSHARALQRNPDLPMAWALSAATCAYKGDFEEAGYRAGRYKALLPVDPFNFFYENVFTIIHLLQHDHAAAARVGRTVTELNPRFIPGYKPYIAALGHLGERRPAEAALARLLKLQPGFRADAFLAGYPLARQCDRDHYAEGLRRAGAP